MAAKSRSKVRPRRRPAAKKAKTARKQARRVAKATRPAKRRPARRVAAKKALKKITRKAARKASRISRVSAKPKARTKVRKAATTKSAKPASKAKAPVIQAKAPAPKAPARQSSARPAPMSAAASKRGRPRTAERPALDRSRRVLSDEERLELGAGAVAQRPSESNDRMMSAARSGHEELRAELVKHTESSPALTAGDMDARWQDAYAVGDEAPGGDNPTPDQDRVDEIGKALGIEYQDDQELQGGEEVTERDRHRWELDPASSDDWPHDKE